MYTPRSPSDPQPDPPTRYGWKQLLMWGAQGFAAPFGLFLLCWAAITLWAVTFEDKSFQAAFETGGGLSLLLFFLSSGGIIFGIYFNQGFTKATGMRMLGALAAIIVMWNVFSRLLGFD